MRRINFTLDEQTVSLLDRLATQFYGGNKSLAIREAVESLAAHSGDEGWVVGGFSPVEINRSTQCHCCATEFAPGATLFKPVFEKGTATNALESLPTDNWLDCEKCAGGHL